jgi:hypothetical protein
MFSALRLPIVFALVMGVCVLQSAIPSQRQDSSAHLTTYKRAANEIAKSNPSVTGTTLDSDLPLIISVEPKVRAHYPSSFSDIDVQHITIKTWMEFRQSKPEGPLDMPKFEQYAMESFGGLQITSQPEGAAIEVDLRQWADTTNSQSSCRTGTRHIKLSKEGYEDELGDAIVTEGRWTMFNRTLKKKK